MASLLFLNLPNLTKASIFLISSSFSFTGIAGIVSPTRIVYIKLYTVNKSCELKRFEANKGKIFLAKLGEIKVCYCSNLNK